MVAHLEITVGVIHVDVWLGSHGAAMLGSATVAAMVHTRSQSSDEPQPDGSYIVYDLKKLSHLDGTAALVFTVLQELGKAGGRR